MRNQKTREEYQLKFNELMKSYIYVPQEGEIIKQAPEPYPAYWFVSNKCYVFSIHSDEIKILKLLHRLTGKKGKKRGQDWYYFYNKKKHLSAHKLIADTFLKPEFEGKNYEIHHKKPRNSFKPNEGNMCNSVDNLQMLPKKLHTQLTTYTNKTEEQHQKEIQKKVKKSNCKQYKYTQEQMQLFVADLLANNDGILLLKRLDDDMSGAYKIKKVKFDGSKIHIEL